MAFSKNPLDFLAHLPEVGPEILKARSEYAERARRVDQLLEIAEALKSDNAALIERTLDKIARSWSSDEIHAAKIAEL